MKRILCAAVCVLLLAALAGCGGDSEFRVIDTYSDVGSFVVAFREGDRLGEYVTAAMKELAAAGTLRTASYRWFGDNLVCIRGENGAMEGLWDESAGRSVTVGIDITNMPMSYEDGTGYRGFDVDLAGYICEYLGWDMTFYPIDMNDVGVELASGNIDMAMGIPENDMTAGYSYSPTYLESRYVLVAQVSGRVRDRSALKGKCLGVSIADVDMLKTDEKFVASLGSITYQTNTDGLFQALLSGEVDGILVSSVVAAYYMNLNQTE